jgi:hypothetical protein
MNRKQLSFLLIAVVVVGGLGLLLRHRDISSFKTTQGRMGQKLLGEFDPNAVVQVVIKHGTNEVHLLKQEDQWKVRERSLYPANFTELGEFLRKITDLKVAAPVTIGPSQLSRLELTAPGSGDKAGTAVELKDKDGRTLRALLLGKKHTRQPATPSPMGGDEGWPDGRYVMVDSKPETVSLVSETFSNIEPKPEQWLNKDFFKVEKVRSVALTYALATNSWKLARETETGEMKLVDAKPEEKLDSTKSSGIPNALSYPSFNDVVADPKPEVTGLDKAIVAVLETFDNFTYTVNIGNKSGEDAYYLTMAVRADLPKERTPGKDEKAEDKERLDKEFKEKMERLNDKLKQEKSYEKATYLVSKWSVDSLLKERHQLLSEKKEEPPKPAEPPPGISAHPPAASAPTNAAAEKVELVPSLSPPKAIDPDKVPLPPTPPALKLDSPAKPAADKEKDKEKAQEKGKP